MEVQPGYLRRSRDLLCDIALYTDRIEVRLFESQLEEDDVKRIIARMKQIAGNDRYPILVIPDKKTKISFLGVRALAGEEAMSYAKSTAYILHSFHHQVMAEAFFSMYQTSRPVQVFSDHTAAMAWLQSFR